MEEIKTQENQQVKQHVEDIGVLLEERGYPPLAARVLGYLMNATPPYKTFEEIREFLGASKSSVSTTLKFLQTNKVISYTTFPGDRKRYFRLETNNWISAFETTFDFILPFKNLIEKSIELRGTTDPEFNQSLEKMVEMYAYLDEEIKAVIKKWRDTRE